MPSFIEEPSFAAAGVILAPDGHLARPCPHGHMRHSSCSCFQGNAGAPLDPEGCKAAVFANAPSVDDMLPLSPEECQH